MYRQTGPSKGNRRPTVATPGSSGSSRPAPQKGGGGNKAAGSVEPTAANTPTVSVSPSGEVSTEHFVPSGPSPAAVRAKREAHAAAAEARRSRQRVRKVKSYVRQRDKELTPKREVKVSKGFLDKAAPPKPVTVAEHARKLPGSEAPRAKPVTVATHQRKMPELKGTKPERVEARQNLQQAKKLVRKTNQPAQISGLRNKSQEEFAAELSKKTGIPPKLAGEWTLQESGASSAEAGGEAGEQNQLGVGYPAHPTSFSQSPYFNNTTPRKAADATAKWMEGKIGGEYDYQAADSIQGIPALAKSGASEEEIRSYIEGPSAWGTGNIAQSGVTATPGKSNPKAVQQYKEARKAAKALGLKVANPKTGAGVAVPYKAFSKHVAADLKAVTHSKGFEDESSTSPITIKSKTGGTLVRNVQGSSGVAAVINKNKDPEIAARLLLLSAKTGKTIEILSGYRTPAQSESVGGFPDDPHTKGEAMDIGVEGATIDSANAISEAEYESVGLYRPFGTAHGGSSTEDNHVQLLNEGSPPTGSSYVEGSEVAGVPSVSGVPSTAIAAYADSTGESPQMVSAKVKAHKGFKKHVEETYLQKLDKRITRLKHLGVEVNRPGEESKAEAANKPGDSSLHKQLAALEAKYSVGAV